MTARRLGATPIGGATRFEVWAPSAERVEVLIGDGETPHELALGPVDGWDGAPTWTATVPDVPPGTRYRYRLDGGDPLPDPASRSQPDGVHGPSAVVDAGAFAWTDEGWPGVELADAVLYELHIGTFTPEGTFDAAIGQLDRLAALGITLVEVMPVNAFPGVRNWGYDGVFPFAVQESYGGPAAMARFVDAAHGRGLGVVLDVVYNHFGPEGNVLPRFAPYLTDAYATPWGGAVNVAGPGSDGVRRFCIENAVGWVTEHHLDGLRLDAVHAIVDPTPTPMVAELTAAVHEAAGEAGRTVLVTLESSRNDPAMVRTVGDHGWGADAVWNDDVHHALRVALTGERHEYYAGYDGVGDLAAALEHRWVYRGQYSPVLERRHGAPADDVDFSRLVVFSTNHDHVGNTPRGERLLHDAGADDPRLRLAAALVLLGPYTPMLFMGEEYGEQAPFPYFIDHGDPDLVEAVRRGRQSEFSGVDWADGVADPADPATFDAAVLDPAQAETAPQSGLLAMYIELLRQRREIPVLTAAEARHEVRRAGDLIVVERSDGASSVALQLNLGPDPVPAVDGEPIFDSADPRWQGRPADVPDGYLAPWSAQLVRRP
jgi:maltooligosyltrehalose trehalohydrolase